MDEQEEHRGGEQRHSIELPVVGMSCANCALTVERILRRKVPGVENALVNLAAETVHVTYDPAVTGPERMAEAVEAAGYRLVLGAEGDIPDDTEQRAREESLRRERRAFFAGVLFTVPLFVLSMGRDSGLLGIWAQAPLMNWLFLLLATPVQFYTGRDFYAGGLKSIRNLNANMDALVALGSSAAYVYSVVVILFPAAGAHVYFETSALIITLVRLGKLLEARAKGNASHAIRRLMDLAPATAHIEETGGESEIPAAHVSPGTTVIVRPGERIPVDGIVIAGESAVDESLMTGESIPADKVPGDPVYGGMINFQGLLKIRATASGRNTALAQIIRLVREAQGSRAPIQRIADRVSAVFVPTIILCAAVTFAAWWIAGGAFAPAMIRMVAVLVVACPCALGLATPTAVMAGSGRGAEMGILFRNSEAIEITRKLTVIFLDKTGTITEGRPKLTEWIPFGPDGLEDLRLTASAESGSEHPLARAVVNGARGCGCIPGTPERFRAVTGSGIDAVVEGHAVQVGKPAWAANGTALSPVMEQTIEALSAAGNTVVLSRIDGRIAGALAVADREKADAASTIRELTLMGIEPVMLTGDTERTARAVASRVGITRVIAGVLPGRKAEVIDGERAQGAIVGMAGDGINDAPALAHADVGIAIGAGADAAKEASDITLVSGDLSGVVRAVRLSRETMRTIRQNLFWAFFYNILLVPVAAGVFANVEWLPRSVRMLHPALAAGAMAFSSVSVVMNSLRLAGKKFKNIR